ncbi:MAG: hypothetical protein JST89_00065 [Cyanobacteria bacterium SZAS-4]|nr:hypothetical protein [Cyanobacteria bacterium SZAS-4]
MPGRGITKKTKSTLSDLWSDSAISKLEIEQQRREIENAVRALNQGQEDVRKAVAKQNADNEQLIAKLQAWQSKLLLSGLNEFRQTLTKLIKDNDATLYLVLHQQVVKHGLRPPDWFQAMAYDLVPLLTKKGSRSASEILKVERLSEKLTAFLTHARIQDEQPNMYGTTEIAIKYLKSNTSSLKRFRKEASILFDQNYSSLPESKRLAVQLLFGVAQKDDLAKLYAEQENVRPKKRKLKDSIKRVERV